MSLNNRLQGIKLNDYLLKHNLKYLKDLPTHISPNENYTYDIKVLYSYIGNFLQLRADTYWYSPTGSHYFSQGLDPNLRIELSSSNYNKTWVILQ